jgi:uncharacterized protein YecE (DUF72 family)
VKGRAATEARVTGPIRHALEVRHESFLDAGFADLARAYGVAVVLAVTAGRFPALDADTSDFAYVRLHGSEELYVSGYAPSELDTWKKLVERRLAKGRDVYVYFDNDARGHAPFDAMALAARLDRTRASRPARRPTGTSIDREEARTSWPAWRRVARAR